MILLTQARRPLFRAFVALICVVGALASPATSRAEDPADVTVSVFHDFHPLTGVNMAGEASGMLVDIWRLWSEKTGIRVKFVIDDFAPSLEAVRSGRADIHGGLFRNAERESWLSFSRTIQESTTGVFYWRAHNAAPSLESLRGRAVGVLAGTHQQTFLRSGDLGFRVRPFNQVTAMLRALARGEIAAVVHNDLSMDTVALRNGVSGEVGRLPVELMRNGIHAGVPRTRPDIAELVDWGLGRISLAEYQAIEERWVDDPADRFFKPRGTVIPFNAAEKKWLAEHRAVRIGMLNSWPPMNSLDEQGRLEGMSPKFLDLLNKRLAGAVLYPTSGSWREITSGVKEKRLDALMDISALRSRQKDYNFTQPYLSIPYAIVGGKDISEGVSLADLSGKRVAVEKGFATLTYLREDNPEIKIIEVADTLAALTTVAEGRADAYFGNQAVVKYQLGTNKKLLSNLQVVSTVAGRQSVLSVAVRKDWPVLRDILDKVLIGLSPAEAQKITAPWLDGGTGQRIEMTPAEQRWLARHLDTKIRVAVNDYPPFTYQENGEVKGLDLAFVRYAAEVLGIEIEPVPLPWEDSLSAIAKRQTVDVITGVARSSDRARTMNLTRDYLSFPFVIFTRTDASLIAGLDDLVGKTVAVDRGHIAQENLVRDYPGIRLLVVDTTHDALEEVSLGKADAYVGNLAAGTYHIERHGYTNLKVAAPTKYKNDTLAFGIRKDWPELASMIDKVLLVMPEGDRAAIRDKALTVKFEYGIDMKAVLLIAVPAMIVVLIIIGIIVYANRRLAGEVAERKNAEVRLKEREGWFRSLLESAPDATVIVNKKGEIVRVNKQAEILFGANREQMVGQPIEVLVPDDVKRKHVAYRDGFVTASAPRSMGANMKLLARKFNGREFPVEISLSPIETSEGFLIAASVRDVTDRRTQEAILAEKDLQLTAALENMSGGMFMVDKNLVIQVFNRKFMDMYQLPEVSVGMKLEELMMIRAVRGDYGEGDCGELVAERLRGYRDDTISRIEDVIEGKTIIEGFRQPTSDGGIVCIFNDITVRRKAEDTLADQRRKLEDLSQKLSRYLSPQIYEAIFTGTSDAQVRTERKKLTVFFSDIKNFTATTEEMEPEDMTYLLNDYLTKMTEIALEHGGTIDKYIGDAIMVFFGDPETKGVKQDALAGVRMAIAMQRRMVDLRAKWADMGFKFPFHIRCGVNTGYCNVGNFGSEQRIDYTIIGGQVNLAARLESICEPDGITIAYETYTHVRDEIDAEPMEPIQVKGIKDPVKPFAVQNVFDDWQTDERYIRRDDILGLRLWVDLMRMDGERRDASVKQLEEAIEILKKRTADAADD